MIIATAHATAPAPPPALLRRVALTDRGVVPLDVVVNAGTPVVWRNVGGNRHTVTADAGAFGSGTLIPGDRFRISAPAAPGVYGYRCLFHSSIRGTVTVSPVRVAPLGPVNAGRAVAVRGSVPRSDAGAEARVERRAGGTWVAAGTAAVGADGRFRVVLPPPAGPVVLRAVVGEDVSPSVSVAVRPVLTVARSGDVLAVTLSPALPGVRVRLERRDAGRWHRVAGRGLAGGRATFHLPAPGAYRVSVPPRGGLTGRVSRVVRFT